MINPVELTETAWKIIVKSLYSYDHHVQKEMDDAQLIGKYLHGLLMQAKQNNILPENVIKLNN